MIFAFIVLSMAGSLNAQLVAVTDNVCSKLAVQDDAILFAKDSPEYGCELWAFSNGTTELFADITPGPASTRPGIEATLGSALIIRSGVLDDDIVPWTVAAFRDGELIPFDNIVGVVGTFAEQVLLVDRNGDDLLAYDGDEMRFLHSGVHGYKSGLVEYEGRAYFGAVWEGIGLEPSYFDGTSVKLLENVTNPGSTWPTGFRVAGGDLYFRNGTNALFKYDGTEVSLIDQFRLEPGVVGNITEFHG
ncbi:MAG: hypothetical protein KDA87_26400, partial [Planctomycetales bacterium]|nr:hypothetical protein [Planctomycetales bacterium]